MPDLVIGVDAGTTGTRCLVISADATIHGRGSAARLSARTSPQELFGQVLRAAIGGLDPARIGAGVFAVAGATTADVELLHAAANMAWWSVGLEGRPRIVAGLVAEFTAGSASPDGLVLHCGRSAAAGAIAGRRLVRQCDGYGWPLGDQGSAPWLAMHAVRAVLDACDGRGARTRLSEDFAAHVGASDEGELPRLLTSRLRAGLPDSLVALVPLVVRAARDGDQVADGLVDSAAERLAAAVSTVSTVSTVADDQNRSGERAADAGQAAPADLVLTGSLLGAGPVRDAVLARIPPGNIREGGPAVAGAALLALADLSAGVLDPAAHAALLTADGIRAR